MMIVKKINNNVAIGVDGNGHEVVLFARVSALENSLIVLMICQK